MFEENLRKSLDFVVSGECAYFRCVFADTSQDITDKTWENRLINRNE